MRSLISTALVLGAASVIQAQRLERVYNRDTQAPFVLKSAEAKTEIKGPLYKQRTVFTFENPFKDLTEASVWFSLEWASVLSGFGYWFKTEYVPGVLMDKNKAWFIYTAITSRNEDPGIMVQTSPSSYHAQIYPLATGWDLRVELTSVGFLKKTEDGMAVPKPDYQGEAPLIQDVQNDGPEPILTIGEGREMKNIIQFDNQSELLDLQCYGQRFKDGYCYIAGIIQTASPDVDLSIKGLRDVFWTRPPEEPSGKVKLFVGRRIGPGELAVTVKERGSPVVMSTARQIHANERGADMAKVWAHQKLIQDSWHSRKAVIDFSLKYGVPSTQTALLAVPQEQMKLFRQKEAEFRKREAEEKRRSRQWQSRRRTNWNQSSGGDPEIRIQLPGAIRAYAILPDGTRFDLKLSREGYWGGNFDIPADAVEGNYEVRIIGVDKSGRESEQTVSYTVDKAAPDGKIEITDGFIVVRSEAGLPKVVAVFGDGSEERMIEFEAGVYKYPLDHRRLSKVLLVDAAHNIRVIDW